MVPWKPNMLRKCTLIVGCFFLLSFICCKIERDDSETGLPPEEEIDKLPEEVPDR